MNLANLDTYTMISLLGFGNLLLLVLLLAYRRNRPRSTAFDYFILARLLHGLGWIFITARGTWPVLITVAAANISLILGVAAENTAFLSYRERSRSRERYFISCAVVGSLVFIIFARTPSLIIAVGALVALSLDIPTAFILLKRSRESSLVAFMGVLFATVSAAFVVRMMAGFQGVLDYTVSQGVIQSSFFLPVFTVLLAGSPALVLLLKGEDERALRESNEKYNALFRSTPSAVFLSEPDSGIILEANPQCIDLTGYAPDEVCGRTFTDLGLWQPGEREKAEAVYRDKGRLVAYEIAARNRAGEDRTWIVSSGLVQLHDKALLASSISDISERKVLETRVQGLLTEKELLLQEVHHRVRNNLSQIMGILQMQMGRPGIPTDTLIGDTVNRVYGMLALYDQVYTGKHYTSVPAREFLRVLTERLRSAFVVGNSVEVTLELEDIDLPPRTISPVGQLVNELFTNSMKYAFEAKEQGAIRVSLRRDGSECVLEYQDDGPGLPSTTGTAAVPGITPGPGTANVPALAPDDTMRHTSGSGFGTILIEALAEQLGAVWEVQGPPGVLYTFRFPAVLTGNE